MGIRAHKLLPSKRRDPPDGAPARRRRGRADTHLLVDPSATGDLVLHLHQITRVQELRGRGTADRSLLRSPAQASHPRTFGSSPARAITPGGPPRPRTHAHGWNGRVSHRSFGARPSDQAQLAAEATTVAATFAGTVKTELVNDGS